ncbi:slipin family protein [Roseivirga misakiensis]|uniref:Peptidase n=1 Tax=Roseivirga misakiensis TaxID=1563681 RepID=A0A1E5SXY8_9BACT|nr:slipin family protein [Roseivirga misakiensis]OEK03993.1 peptidase [Roseivirga misakiensis]
MKRIRINQGKVGLVFRKGDYRNVLTAGTHWVSLLDAVVEYDMVKPFYAPKTIDLFLNDEKLVAMLNIVRVGDHKIALKYKRGNFKEVLTPGTYAFWKGLIDYSFVKVDLTKIEITEDIDLSVKKDRALIPYIRVCKVESYEKAILMVNGSFYKELDPGDYYFWKNEIALNMLKADMRQVQMEVTGQEILTKDKAALRINFYGQYKVMDIVKALIDNKDFEKQLYVLMQIALREFVGKFTLDELLEEKDSLADYVKKVLQVKAKDLGIEIRDCGVKDIILPGEVKNIMNQVLVAQKQAQANVVARREETASTRNLLNTAKLMEDNEMLFKLKEMEYVEKIADKVSNISLSGGHKVVDQLKEVFTGFK